MDNLPFEELESELDKQLGEVVELREIQLRKIRNILSSVEEYVSKKDIEKTDVFNYISNIISYKIGVDIIWDWIYKLSQKYSYLCYDQLFIIGLTEPATEAPVDISDLHGYMQRINQSQSFADLIFESYNREGFPNNILNDYLWYCNWRTEKFLPSIPFPYAWLQEYIDECSDPD